MTRGRKYSIADVRQSYTPAKAREEWLGDWASALIYRPLSILITPTFIYLGFSAKLVTAVSFIIGLSLPLIAAYGGRRGFLAVAGLAILWAILDCVDGNIARVTKTASDAGHYLDLVTDVAFRGCFYAAIGMLSDSSPASSGAGLAQCMLAAYLAMAARVCRLYGEQRSRDDVYSTDIGDLPEKPLTPVQLIYSFLSGIDRLLPLMVLAGGLLRRMDWVPIFLLIYMGLDFIYTQFAIARRLTIERP